jgi:hypothetical protein
MKSSDTTGKVLEALWAAQAEMGTVSKDGFNKEGSYSFANIESYVSMVRPILKKHDLSFIESVESVETLAARTKKSGTTWYAVRVVIACRICHKSGEWIEGGSAGEGEDFGDKAVYKAITGARKYGYAGMFGLATGDEPEAGAQGGENENENERFRKPTNKKNAPGGAKVDPAAAPLNPDDPLPQEYTASPEQIILINSLIIDAKIPVGTIKAWLAKAQVEKLEDLYESEIQKCIDYATKRLPKRAPGGAKP